MRIREEAKRQGAVLSYHRIAEQSTSDSDPNIVLRTENIVLLTEYKNHAAYDARGKLFASIFKQLPGKSSGVLLHYQHKDREYASIPGLSGYPHRAVPTCHQKLAYSAEL